MLKSAQDEAQQNAKESIAQIIGASSQEPEVADPTASSSSRGFLGKFSDTMKYLGEDEEMTEKEKAAKEEKAVALKAKIDNEIAPKIAVQALGEALIIGSERLGVS